MESRQYNKILNYKYRFIKTLSFLGNDNALLAAKEIAKLPDEAENGYEDAYLTAMLINIALTYITEADFNEFEDDSLRLNMLHALFAESEAECSVQESIDNVFAYCDVNKNADPEETLENAIGGEFEIDEFIHDKLKLLKSSCESFIAFYKNNKPAMDKSCHYFPDTVKIENLHKGPLTDNQTTKELSHPKQTHIMEKNGKLIINNLEPCLGIVIIAENNNDETACLGHHLYPMKYYGEDENGNYCEHPEQMFAFTKKLITELADKGYSQRTRFFLSGGNLSSFSLALQLIMQYWQENTKNPFAHADFYLSPSPSHCQTFCFVKLKNNQCSILTGAELFDHDSTLCEVLGIEYEGDLITDPDADLFTKQTDETSSEEESEETSSDEENEAYSSDADSESASSEKENNTQQPKRKWMTFYSSSSDDDNDIQPVMKKRHYK